MDRKAFLQSLIAPAPKLRPVMHKPAEQTTRQQEAEETPLYLQSGIAPYTGTWTKGEVIHLLKRLMFGAVKEEVDYFSTLTYTQAVDELLNTINTAPGKPLKTYTPDTASTLAGDLDWSVPLGNTWVNTPTNSGSVNSNRQASVKSWWTGLMLNQPRSIEEKMILFWSTHLTVEFDTVSVGTLTYKYLTTLRTYALGNYKSFVKAITLDPAMLIYLNGRYNTKTAPDENYARELQELFTLGKGPDSQYTEADVKAAAKVLTGYTVNTATATSAFDSTRHDTTNKQFSAFYGNAVITGRTGANGAQELDDLLDLIFTQQEVAKYICRRIYRFFVYGNIDATIEANVITPLANVFRSNNYEIKPVLNTLFKSEHFFDVLTQGAMIKSPADFVIGMQREMKNILPPASNPVMQYRMLNYLAISTMSSMDQNPGDPPNVSGWAAYYQEPLYDKVWLSTDTYTKRRNFITTMLNGYTNTNQRLIINPIEVARRMSNPADPNALVQDFNTYFLRMQLATASLATIKQNTLLTGQTSDYYWTNAWNAYIANPSLQSNINDITTRLRNLVNYFMLLEEYHLM
jgi:uncharacterized protein (DUF1800 family)